MKKNQHIGNWYLDPKDRVSVGNFAANDSENNCVFPGQLEADSAYTIENENAKPIVKTKLNPYDYAFCIEKDNYFYGITKDNKEIIAAKDGETLTPISEGAGSFVFKKDGKTVFTATAVTDYTVNEDGEYTTVTVNYSAEGDYGYLSRLCNIYTFKDLSFTVDAVIECTALCDGINEYYFGKKYLNDYKNHTKRLAMDWAYPENDDFAYKTFGGLIVAENYGDYSLYTNILDENCDGKVIIRDVLPEKLLLCPEFTKDFTYKYHISYAVVKSDEKESYIGLFKSKNYDFAAGVACNFDNDNNTFFMGKDIDLNLNVTNIKEGDINYNVKYEILDYNGEKQISETYYNNTLASGSKADRRIKMTLPKYGIYYLNFYVVTENSEYKETYTFCLIEEYEFKHRKNNKFGICATHSETVGQARSTAKICGKMGLSLTRDGRSLHTDKLHEYLIAEDVDRYTGVGRYTTDPAGIVWEGKDDDLERMMQDVKDSGYMFDDEHCVYCFVANEIDAPAKANYAKSVKLLTEKFIPYTFNPIYDYIKENHPKALDKMIWQSNCHGTTEYLEAFHETGLWDKSAIIDIHSYSSPSGPDKMFTNSIKSMHANTYSNEYAMERWKRLKKRYGEKRMMVGETGYPAAPFIGNRCENDPKTVADFNVRIAMFFLEAGAEDIIYYCIFDRTSWYIGGGAWNEMYFGACYNYDYYGVYMPKPWAAAYCNLTRVMDGHKKVSYFDKYEEGEFGTLRAFKVEKEQGEFAVLWSNIFELQNTTIAGRVDKVERKPMPLWANRWEKTEIREFDAVGDTVTVVDIMGNSREIKAENGKVKIEISGSPIYVYGIC